MFEDWEPDEPSTVVESPFPEYEHLWMEMSDTFSVTIRCTQCPATLTSWADFNAHRWAAHG